MYSSQEHNIRFPRNSSHLVHGANRSLGILEESIQAKLALFFLLSQHFTTSFFNDGPDVVNVFDEPVDTETSFSGVEITSVVRSLLNTTCQAKARVEVEFPELIRILVVGVLEVEVEYSLVENCSYRGVRARQTGSWLGHTTADICGRDAHPDGSTKGRWLPFRHIGRLV